MSDYEKLGAFYLGKTHDIEKKKTDAPVILYDAKDLTTHAVIIGMTGSGKTGLGIGLLEEALIDHIPVIAIDPKGDLANLALRFPNLSPEDSTLGQPTGSGHPGYERGGVCRNTGGSLAKGVVPMGPGCRAHRSLESGG